MVDRQTDHRTTISSRVRACVAAPPATARVMRGSVGASFSLSASSPNIGHLFF